MGEYNRAACIELLCGMSERLAAQGLARYPQRSDFSESEVVAIKSFLGPWPRALEAAGLKSVDGELVKRKQEKRAASRLKKRLNKSENRSENMSANKSVNGSQNKPENVSVNMSDNQPEKMSEPVSVNMSDNQPENMSEPVSVNMPENRSVNVSENVSETGCLCESERGSGDE